MSSKENTERIIDASLRLLVTSSAIGAGLVLPNLLVALDKPLDKYFKHLDHREREREAKRIIYYMKSRGLIAGEYEFGLNITKKGSEALAKLDFEHVAINSPAVWDKTWRIIFYDIPEEHRPGRNSLTAKLRAIGFFQLQKSVWIHPFPCRGVIEKITTNFEIEKFVSYVETLHLDNEAILIKRFQKHLPNTKF